MSKYLIKILAICAFVMLLPLAAVATSLAVVGTREYTLRVDIAGDTNTSASANVLINGQDMDSITIVAGTTVELSFENTGYHFLGWYEGTEGTYKPEAKPISKQTRFSLKITDNTDLTAVCTEKVYTVNYTGFKEDGTTPISEPGDDYKYGDELITPSKANEGSIAKFVGWKIEGDQSDKTHTHIDEDFAAYENGAQITLIAVWNTKIVTYYDAQGKPISSSSKYYNSETIDSFNLMSASDAEKYVSAGHHFVGFKYLNSNVEINADKVESIKNNFNTAPLYIQIVEEKDVYNLTFTGFNETGVEDTTYSRQYTFGEPLPPTEEREGFNGWTIDGSGDVHTTANFSNYENGATINLVANWSSKEVTFVYADGHKVTKPYTKAEFDALNMDDFTTDETHISEGYHAAGWKVGEDVLTAESLKEMQGAKYESTAITLVVYEEKDVYNLTFTGFNETGVEDTTYSRQYTFGEPLPPTEEREGFNGWTIDGSGDVHTTANFSNYENGATINLVANWSSKEVTFVYADGHKVTKPYTKAEFDALNMDDFTTDETHISEGYHAAGWKVGEDVLTAESLKEMQGAKYESTAITLVVYEEKDEYTVKYSGFKEDGTSPINQTATRKYGDELMIPEKASAESRAEFVGWKIEGDQSETTYLEAKFAAYEDGAQITLIAVWEEKPETSYTLKMEGFIGNAADSITIKASDYSALSNWEPGDRSYYTFKGFNYNGTSYNNENYQALVDAIVADGATEVTLTAEWTCEIDVANFDVWHIIGGDYNEEEDAIFFFNEGATITSMETTLLEAFFGTTDGSTTVTVKGQSYTVSNIVIYYANTADDKVSVADNGIGSYTFADLAGFVDGKGYDAKTVFESKEGLRIEFTLQAK